jgi:O-acetylserine/cysteine efflux transporter
MGSGFAGPTQLGKNRTHPDTNHGVRTEKGAIVSSGTPRTTSAPAGIVAVFAATLCWGSTVVMLRVASHGLGAVAITAVELTAAAVALTVAVLVRRPPLPRLNRRIVLAALLEPGITYVIINAGIARTSGSHAALLIGTEAVFIVVVGAVAARTRPRSAVIAGLVLALVGAAFLSGDGGSSASASGDLLIVIGCAAGAGYVVAAGQLLEQMDPLVLTAYQFGIGWLANIVAVGSGTVAGLWDPFASVDATSVAAAAVSGVLGSALAFGLYNWALPRITAQLAGTSLSGVPLFGAALSIVALGDPVSGVTVVAGATVLIGLVLTVVSDSRPPVPVEPEPMCLSA